MKRIARSGSPVSDDAKAAAGHPSPIVEKFVRFCSSDFGRRVLDWESGYLHERLKDRKRILDVGCGIGSFEERLAGLDITGLDSSEEMLQEARRRSSKTFVLGDAQRLPFANSSFDAVFFVTSLEFLDDYGKAIAEAARVLEEKGKLVVLMLNPASHYFGSHASRPDSDFRRIRHTDIREIERYVSKYFEAEEGYIMGIDGERIFETSETEWAALYAIIGVKKPGLTFQLPLENMNRLS